MGYRKTRRISPTWIYYALILCYRLLTYVLFVRSLADPEIKVGVQCSASHSRHGLPQTLRKLQHCRAVQLHDVVLDHLGVQLALREHGLSAHVEERADVFVVGQGERHQVRDDEGLHVHQHHDPRWVRAAHDSLLGLAHIDLAVATLHRFVGSRFARLDALRKGADTTAAAEKAVVDISTGEQMRAADKGTPATPLDSTQM